MSDVIDRPMLEEEAAQKAGCASSIATSIRACIARTTQSVPAEALAGASENLRRSSAHALYRHHALSAVLAPDRAARRLAADRRPAGLRLAFMRKQHLDPLEVEFGILQVLDLFIFSQQNLEFGAAIQRAINEWQLAYWSDRDPRLKASILAGQDDTALAIAEIERCAKIGATSRSSLAARQRAARPPPLLADLRARPGTRPAARHSCRRLWRARADRRRLAVLLLPRSTRSTRIPWRRLLASLVIEGVPERFPRLKIVFIEGGFGWIPSAMWRMDQHFERFRSEVPHLKRHPSEYVREHFWFTTQPIDEPDEARHLRSLIEWVGVDRLLFSSDYPHWDFDDPRFAFKTPLTETERAKSSAPTPARSTSSESQVVRSWPVTSSPAPQKFRPAATRWSTSRAATSSCSMSTASSSRCSIVARTKARRSTRPPAWRG